LAFAAGLHITNVRNNFICGTRKLLLTLMSWLLPLLGRLNIGPDCTSVRDALSQGNYRLVEPRLRDIEIGGTRLQVDAIAEGVATCRR